MSVEPFRRLVKLIARAFYDDEIPPRPANRPKSDKSDNKGIAVVILDALTRREWVKEEDLARQLCIHPKQLRRTLRVLEEEMIVIREHRRESVKSTKVLQAAMGATSAPSPQEGDLPTGQGRLHTHSYCCLDYAQIYDVIRYRLHRAKRKIKDELEDRNVLQEYVCPNPSCRRRYSALDALRLISLTDELFHCEGCNADLVAESDKLAAAAAGEGGEDNADNARRKRRELLKEMLHKLEKQLKPLTDQVEKIKDLTPPDFGPLAEWVANTALRVDNRDPDVQLDGIQSKQQSAPIPYWGETNVEVDLGQSDVKQEETEAEAIALKQLPPWMIRQGMKLTPQQWGVGEVGKVKAEVKAEPSSSCMAGGGWGGLSKVKKEEGAEADDKEAVQRQLQEAYVKAYYEALVKRQQELTGNPGELNDPGAITVKKELVTVKIEPDGDRLVGLKVKRERSENDEDEDEEDVEWEAGTEDIAGAGGALDGEDDDKLTWVAGEDAQDADGGGDAADDGAGEEARVDDDDAAADDDDVDWENGGDDLPEDELGFMTDFASDAPIHPSVR
eukprot:TRINITY_DN9071_c0_g1_i2.p1 TRINITY_DN9071_c0_g1~~TRINITY_DN9071_c0_g1_i2.p1  ORF type:complete len:559 (+),score=161.15 TRINITY_DN9071_c0_g1_i2:41-1717(+)